MIEGDSSSSNNSNPRPAPVDPLIGRSLNGRFTILDALGMGGMGKVYRATQTPLDRVVALKVLNPNFPTAKDPGFQKRFMREAALTSKLRHPNTVTVIDYGQTDDGIYFIAMEYLEGRTLAQELQKSGALTWTRALNVAQQICRSLREAHNLGVVHRDLKPANIMLLNESDQDLVKVLDFGLVKSISPAGDGPSVEVTQNGTFLGSPQYMAPEQARNVSDARSDVYSLGVVLYQMLMGRPPFVSKDHIELIFAHYKEIPPAFGQLRPDLGVPQEIEQVVRRCLEKDPARRYQTMDELLEAMRQAYLATGGTNSGVFKRPPGAPGTGPFNTPTTGPHTSPLFASAGGAAEGGGDMAVDISMDEPKSKKGLVIGGVALASVLLGFGGVMLLKGKDDAPAPQAQAAAPAPAAPAQAAAQAEAPLPPVSAGKVRIRLDSLPKGATVIYKGKERGTTPFHFELPLEGGEIFTGEFTFALDGYQSETVFAGGAGEVVLVQRLQRKAGGSDARASSSRDRRDTRDAREPARESGGGDGFESAASLEPAPQMVSAAPAVSSGGVPSAASALLSQPAAQPASGGTVVPASARAEAPAAAAAPAVANGPIPYSEAMGRPQVVEEGKPFTLTREAIAARVQGTMIVRCTIQTSGRVNNCRILKPVQMMEKVVLESLLSKRFKPMQYQGKTVAVDYVFNIPIGSRR